MHYYAFECLRGQLWVIHQARQNHNYIVKNVTHFFQGFALIFFSHEYQILSQRNFIYCLNVGSRFECRIQNAEFAIYFSTKILTRKQSPECHIVPSCQICTNNGILAFLKYICTTNTHALRLCSHI